MSDRVITLLVVDDSQATFDQAVAVGATPILPVAEMHCWLTGRVKDPFGLH